MWLSRKPEDHVQSSEALFLKGSGFAALHEQRCPKAQHSLPINHKPSYISRIHHDAPISGLRLAYHQDEKISAYIDAVQPVRSCPCDAMTDPLLRCTQLRAFK
ncbi:hypothetical protein KEM48_002612 [Puccinia striiformis f. sp. tritici PST-130]|nr:hypothetical protein KEM48_002612 [Puccinia striiformis f. sp. tritici PST-130]